MRRQFALVRVRSCLYITEILPTNFLSRKLIDGADGQGCEFENEDGPLRLAMRTEPDWRSIDPGAHLGYYRGRRGGSWVARLYQDGRYRKTAISTADDTSDADGVAILSFAQAQAAARKWFSRLARDAAGIEAPAAGPYRVRDQSRTTSPTTSDVGKALAATEVAANAHIYRLLGDAQLDRLTARRIREWHSGLAEAPARLRKQKGVWKLKTRALDPDDTEAMRRRRATANRVLTVLKAALNHAFREGRVPNDEAWRRVKPFREADAARVRIPPMTRPADWSMLRGLACGRWSRLRCSPDAVTASSPRSARTISMAKPARSRSEQPRAERRVTSF